MKLKGFTLAEILITLSIIGVVSALTLPGLVTNVSSTRVAAALSKAQNSLENANFQYLSNESSDSLRTTCTGKGTYLQCMADSGYLKISPAGYKTSILKYQGNYNVEDNVSGYIGKDGIAYYPVSGGNWITLNDNSTKDRTEGLSRRFGTRYAAIWVDINGSKAPNEEGKDVFQFWIDEKGEVIPYGGATFAAYYNTNVWWKGTQEVFGEYSGCGPKSVANSLSCAGSIIDNGRVIYKY